MNNRMLRAAITTVALDVLHHRAWRTHGAEYTAAVPAAHLARIEPAQRALCRLVKGSDELHDGIGQRHEAARAIFAQACGPRHEQGEHAGAMCPH